MSLRIEEMLVESELDLAELGDVVELLAPLGELAEASPLPSDELEELFDPTAPVRPISASARRRGAVAGAVVLAISGVGATGLSAAANTLPRPLQHGVSQFSQRYLPFDLPEPPKHATSPLGVDSVPPAHPSLDVGRASSEPTSRSIPGRDPAVGAYPKGQPAQKPVARPSASPSPSLSPSYSAFAAGPSASPSAQPSPSGSPSPGEGNAGRPAANPSAHPSDQKPGKGSGKGGHDGKGKNHGPGPTDPGPQGDPGAAPVPGGQDPAPTSPSPLPDDPGPTLPLPDPLPDLGPVIGTGTVAPGADAG